jgi:hypothetical protein
MARLSYQRQYGALESETAEFAAAVRDTDPDAPEPTCPDWTLAQPATHLYRGTSWAATMVERRTTTPARPTDVDADLPADPDERTSALLAAARLVAAAVTVEGDARLLTHWPAKGRF